MVVFGVIAAVLVLAIGGAFAAGVFSGGGGGESGPLEASTNVKLEPGELEVKWPGLGPGQTDPDLPDQVMAVIGKYVDNGIVPGLRTGKVKTAALADAFDLGALDQLDGEARGTLLDEKLPKAIGKLTIIAPPIEITALNDADNKTVLASAKVDLDIRVRSAKGFYSVKHEGELVLAPDTEGTWRVTGWDVKALRTPPAARAPWVTTTTAEKKK